MRKVSGERIICAAFWRKPRRSSAMLSRPRLRERNHEQPKPHQPPASTTFYPPKSRDSILWRNWPWICIGRGTMPPTKCGGSLIPKLWEITHNPWVVLQTVSRDRIERVLADPAFRQHVDDLVEASRQAAEAPAWFQQNHPAASADLRRVFQHGVHAERSFAHLLGRAGQCGRRSAQSRQRPGCAGGRRGTALPAGLFSPGDRQERGATGPVPV